MQIMHCLKLAMCRDPHTAARGIKPSGVSPFDRRWARMRWMAFHRRPALQQKPCRQAWLSLIAACGKTAAHLQHACTLHLAALVGS